MVLAYGPLLHADAIVVLMGEDAEVRLRTGLNLLAARGAPMLVLSGGRSEPPAVMDAKDGHRKLLGLGVDPEFIRLEDQSQNTHEQAAHVVAIAVAEQWRNLLVVASPYHLPRAVLTFVAELKRRGLDRTIHVIGIPASDTQTVSNGRWWQRVPGRHLYRVALLDDEAGKVDAYGEHVASYADGLEYLRFWEEVVAGNIVPDAFTAAAA